MAFTQEQRIASANCVAQMFALRAWSPGDAQLSQDIVSLFNTFLMLIAGTPYQLIITPGKISHQSDPSKVRDPHFTPGGAVQIHDDEQFPLQVQAVDTKGFPVPDTSAVTFSSSDDTVLSLQDDGSGGTNVVAGQPGSAVITGSDGNLSGTLAVDVTAGDIAALSITAGAVEKQPPPAP